MAVNVSLSPELEKIVTEKVASGQYASADAVLGEALRLLEERDRLSKLRHDVALGIEQLDQGRSRPFSIQTLKRIRREAF
jgi:antitoxin ParD1/3/4